jgi:2-polyprenyl-3-methyl-5-hydroxy-6-metoxy-1,4-benzoquinol methylase
MAAVCRSLAALGGVLPTLVDAYRTGDGVAVEGPDAVEAQGDFNRPWLVGSFATEYLPQVPDVHAKLTAGARVADVACGVGWAAISIARGYPATTVDGFDLDEPAITLARSNAQAAGVADRVTFQARDAADPSLSGQYDLAVIVEALHDMSRPVDVLATVRRLLVPGGTLILADERVADAFYAPADPTERLFYGYSVLDCLPTGMVSKPSAETGTVMRRSTLERYASEAEFSAVSVLPIEHDFLRFYRLDP